MARPAQEYEALSISDLISLKGRSAIITGGARGLGYAIAKRFAEAGANLLLGDKNKKGADEAAQKLASKYGITALSSFLDVADSASMKQFAAKADAAFGTMDIWVNNAESILPRSLPTPLMRNGILSRTSTCAGPFWGAGRLRNA